MHEHLVTPGKSAYALVALILFVGAVIFVAYVYDGILSIGDNLTQFSFPGTHRVMIQEPDTYTIYYEPRSIMDGKVFSTPRNLSGVDVTVTSPSGAPLFLKNATMNETYSFSSREGVAVLTFSAPQPGLYTLSASHSTGAAEPRFVLTLGHNFSTDLVGLIFGGFAIGFVTFAGAVGVFVIVWRKRKNSRALLEARFSQMARAHAETTPDDKP